MGSYGPIRAHMGPILLKKSLILMNNLKIINKIIKVVKLEISKIKTWFCDKDLENQKLLSKTDDFVKNYKFS